MWADKALLRAENVVRVGKELRDELWSLEGEIGDILSGYGFGMDGGFYFSEDNLNSLLAGKCKYIEMVVECQETEDGEEGVDKGVEELSLMVCSDIDDLIKKVGYRDYYNSKFYYGFTEYVLKVSKGCKKNGR
jgi:hypothetical protein